MSFDQRMANRSLALLKKYGASMILKRTLTGELDPATGKKALPVVTTYKCKGLVQFITRTSANQFYGTSTLQSTLIQKDDEMCFIAAQDLEITPQHPTDTLIVGDKTYNVMFCTPLKAASLDVMYVLQIRK